MEGKESLMGIMPENPQADASRSLEVGGDIRVVGK